MKKKLLSAFIGLSCSLPLSAFANILISNHSTGTMTAKLDSSPCSSIIGEKGIMRPGKTMTVPQDLVNMYCSFSTCQVRVYLSNNCSGKKMADVTVTAVDGITKVSNFDMQYKIEGAGNYAVITNGA